VRLRERLEQDRQIVRQMLPRLEREIENSGRDLNSVGEVLRPYYLSAREAPMTPADLPGLERLCRLILERGGSRQNDIQEVMLRLIGATAAVESVSCRWRPAWVSQSGRSGYASLARRQCR
jgi:hypothetical protein